MFDLYKEGRQKGCSPERFEELKKADPRLILMSGKEWANFPYEEGYELLKEKDGNGELLFRAGKYWEVFPYEDAAEYLINRDVGYLARIILANWPIDISSYWERDDGRNVLVLYRYGYFTKEEALEHPKLTERFRRKLW